MNFDMTKEQDLDRQLLRELLVEVEIDGVKYPVGQPSAGRYRGEDYGWDPVFFIHSLLAVGETRAAIRMMDGVARKIELAGYLPLVTRWNRGHHDLLWKLRTHLEDPRFTAEIQPPLVAQTALHLIRTIGLENLDRDRVLTWIQAAQANIDWLMEHRRAEGRKLFFIIDPVESGEDSLPVWDEIAAEKGWRGLRRNWRIFLVSSALNWRYVRKNWEQGEIEEDPGSVLIEPVSLNVLAIREMLALGILWRQLANLDMAVQVELWARGQQVALDELWDVAEEAYFPSARFGKSDWRQMATYSVESLYPLLLPNLAKDRVARIVQTIERRFVPGAKYLLPIAPVDPEHPVKVLGRVPIWWPGQVWANTNWFFRDALAYQSERLAIDPKRKFTAEAAERLSKKIDSDWLKLKGLAGYPEFYFQNGTGGAEKRFFWSCLRRSRFRVEIR